jgi:hypothetical protein
MEVTGLDDDPPESEDVAAAILGFVYSVCLGALDQHRGPVRERLGGGGQDMGRVGLEIICGGVVASVERHVCVAIRGRDLVGIGLVRVHFANSWVKLERNWPSMYRILSSQSTDVC